MKKHSKLISILLVGVMVIGMAFTAVAANGSPSNPSTDEEKANAAVKIFYNKVTIAAGGGSISDVTDQKTLASAYDQHSEALKYIRNTLGPKFNKPVYEYRSLLFNVNGVKSGEVTLQLNNDGKFDASKAVGKLVLVYHYNSSTGAWEIMKDANGNDQLAEVDENGRLTISFPSYSPIMASVLNVSASDVKEGSSVSVRKVNMNPKQVLTSSSSKKSPKMGE